MAIQFVEPNGLKCSGCGASRDHLTLVKSRRTSNSPHMICTEIYRCEVCQHETGTIRAESSGSAEGVATAC
jgi:hypothetical protein